jgi:hypothetical protein
MPVYNRCIGKGFRMLPVHIFCLIRNEAQYLAEWIEFHRAQGVERIWLFDNESTDNPAAVAAPYGDFVQLRPQPGLLQQMPMYVEQMTAQREPCWGAFIDADEFLHSTTGQSLPAALAAFAEARVGAVAVHWVLFGPCGQERYDPRPVRSRFPEGTPDWHVKSIVRLPAALRSPAKHAHCFDVTGETVDECGRPVLPDDPWPEPIRISRLRIDHYWSKSVEEYRSKCRRGSEGSNGQASYDPEAELRKHAERRATWLKTGQPTRYAGQLRVYRDFSTPLIG